MVRSWLSRILWSYSLLNISRWGIVTLVSILQSFWSIRWAQPMCHFILEASPSTSSRSHLWTIQYALPLGSIPSLGGQRLHEPLVSYPSHLVKPLGDRPFLHRDGFVQNTTAVNRSLAGFSSQRHMLSSI